MGGLNSKDIASLISNVNHVAKTAGIEVDYKVIGRIKIEDLGFDLGFSNKDCNGVCSTNCSGCSACSGCSGCSSTSTSTSKNPAEAVINPDPLTRFVNDLRDPAIQELIMRAKALTTT